MTFAPKTSCFIAISLLALASCTLSRDPNTDYTNTGEPLGAKQRKEITLAESRVSFIGTDPTKKHEAQNLRDRYLEIITLKNNGTITYDKLFKAFYADHTNEDNLISQVENWDIFKKEGISLPKASIKKRDWFAYATLSSSSYTCFMFRGKFGYGTGPERGEGQNEEAFGGICYRSAAKTADAIEAEMLEILSRIRFDDGAINKAKSATAQPAT
jgi:hypothetical protein